MITYQLSLMALRQVLLIPRCLTNHIRFGSSAVSVSSVHHDPEIKTKVLVENVKKIRLDKFATYNQVMVDTIDPRISSGLVLLLPWTLAKDSHVAKFEKYYLKKGFNVLTVNTPTRHLFLSTLYRRKLETIAHELQSPNKIMKFNKMLVHAFSIGHFVLGQLLVEMDKYSDGRKIPTDVVLDSALDYRTLIFALVRTFPLPTAIQDSLYPVCNILWKKLIPGLGVKPNEKVYDRIHNEPFDRSLILTSKVDPIGTEEYSKQLIEICRSNGSRVHGRIFESSAHVTHFVKYQKEYLALLEPFVDEFIRKT